METISIDELKRRIRSLDGIRLETAARRRGFWVHLSEEGPTYVPETTGEPRDDTWERISLVLGRYNETGSTHPGDYPDLTHHASYVLAVLAALFSNPVPGRARPPEIEPVVGAAVSAQAPEKPNQRIGAVSNAHVGRDFERVAQEYFLAGGVALEPDFAIEIGLGTKKLHRFDLGASTPRVLVECKSHRWTTGGQVPSAKMTVWNEAMYYFFLAPSDFRKCFFVLHDRRRGTGETLLGYYRRTYPHLIPKDVEFFEWDETLGRLVE